MKLKWRKIEKDGKGQIALEPQEEEDMWHLYNLIQEGDLIKATTFRNVKTTGTTGTVKSEKKRVTVTLQVDSVDFDTKSASMRVSGRNREENKFIRMNAHHTVELAVHRSLTLIKDRWDSIHLERVKMATDPTQSADLAAIVLQEGLAHVCLITSYTTLIRQKVQMTVPRKRMGSDTRHKRALERFYASIYDAVVRHINFDVVKCVLVASPAFYKEELVKRIFELASKSGNRKLLENRSKFVKRQAASGHMQALRQVLADQSCSDLIKTTKAFEEVKALEDFFTMMNKNPDRAFMDTVTCCKPTMPRPSTCCSSPTLFSGPATLRRGSSTSSWWRWHAKTGPMSRYSLQCTYQGSSLTSSRESQRCFVSQSCWRTRMNPLRRLRPRLPTGRVPPRQAGHPQANEKKEEKKVAGKRSLGRRRVETGWMLLITFSSWIFDAIFISGHHIPMSHRVVIQYTQYNHSRIGGTYTYKRKTQSM